MRLPAILLLTTLAPAVWGWLIYWVISRWWPRRERARGKRTAAEVQPSLPDYQI